MTVKTHKPFHPQGLASSKGGVVIDGQQVKLIDPETGTVLRSKDTVTPLNYKDLYVEGKIFDLFPNSGNWYIAKQWEKEATLIIERDDKDFVEGEIIFHGVPSAIYWDAKRYYGAFITWDIQVDLPRDHLIEGDISLQIALAGAIYNLLENYRTDKQFNTRITNFFDRTLLKTLPFRVNRMGDDPKHYMEAIYGWLWQK